MWLVRFSLGSSNLPDRRRSRSLSADPSCYSRRIGTLTNGVLEVACLNVLDSRSNPGARRILFLRLWPVVH